MMRRWKERMEKFARLAVILFVAAAVLSPTATRLWRSYDVARFVEKYQTLVRQECYQEARWVANLARETYPDSKAAKHLAMQGNMLLSAAESLCGLEFANEDDPFAVFRDISEISDSTNFDLVDDSDTES
jgi:hypothetical protein